MPNLSLHELKQISKMRRIKGYKNMSKERLLNALDESESAKSLDNAKIKKIKEDFKSWRDRFLKPKIKKITKNLFEKKKKYLSGSEVEEIEKNLFGLEESISKLKKYYYHDDAKYIAIRDVGNLLNQSTDKDYYKPIETKSAFNGNYIEYESNGDKNKNLSAKKYINLIRPYFSDTINDYKAFKT